MVELHETTARSAIAALIVAVLALVGECQRSASMPGTISSDHVMVDRGGPTAPWGKAVGDINRDGRPGLVVGGHKGGGPVCYENPGWHKHLIVAEGAFSTDHEVAELDKDGCIELPLDTRWLRNEAGGRWSVYNRVSG